KPLCTFAGNALIGMTECTQCAVSCQMGIRPIQSHLALSAAIRTTKCQINQTGDVLRRRPILPLAAQAETADQRLVTCLVDALDIVKKTTTLRNQLQKAATRMIVILVALEM